MGCVWPPRSTLWEGLLMTLDAKNSRPDPSTYGKVAVLMGGWAAEREISLESGQAVLAALRRGGVDAHGVDVDQRIAATLRDAGFDRVFVALHGRGGEDGVIQGVLETLGLPYTGSGVLGSAIGMDKVRTKMLWQSAGLPTPPHRVIANEAELDTLDLGWPVMVKPVHEGSSLGTGRADSMAELRKVWKQAASYDREVMEERWVSGDEYTAAVLAGQVLPLIKLETPRGYYDYQAKYQDESTRYICPCGLDADTEAELQAMALQAFHTLGARGWGRVDFFLDGRGKPWLIELNTIPGMTSHSLVPMAAAVAGIDFDELVLRILDTAAVGERAVGPEPSGEQ